ncbi:DUF4287 domain-containing protein [Aquabacterium humicola]|uniref:DUF4287 domain-containing protein n=1 Tax=Aquabacterium humicola TaxID=3237377 RepID=UPI0025426C78|nr:DUF4287 domain-containing protein [Rubrivivax pictus]
MTFEAYISNIHAKTGKTPKDFHDEAVAAGVLGPDTRTMVFVDWLKQHSGLGHGHAMAVWEAFRRNGWLPAAAPKAARKTTSRPAPTAASKAPQRRVR